MVGITKAPPPPRPTLDKIPTFSGKDPKGAAPLRTEHKSVEFDKRVYFHSPPPAHPTLVLALTFL